MDFLYLTKRFSESFDQCRITVHGPAAGQPHSGHPQPVAHDQGVLGGEEGAQTGGVLRGGQGAGEGENSP